MILNMIAGRCLLIILLDGLSSIWYPFYLLTLFLIKSNINLNTNLLIGFLRFLEYKQYFRYLKFTSLKDYFNFYKIISVLTKKI